MELNCSEVVGCTIPHQATVCRQFLDDVGIDTIDWPTHSPDQKPIEHLWNIMFWFIWHHQVAHLTLQKLIDALLQIWERFPRETIPYLNGIMHWWRHA